MTDDERLKPLPALPAWVEDTFKPTSILERDHNDIVGISKRLELLVNRTDAGFGKLTEGLEALAKSILPAIDRLANTVENLTNELRMTQAEVGQLKRSQLDANDRLNALERRLALPEAIARRPARLKKAK